MNKKYVSKPGGLFSQYDKKYLEKNMGEVLGLERSIQKEIDKIVTIKSLNLHIKRLLLGIKSSSQSHERVIHRFMINIEQSIKDHFNINFKNVEINAYDTECKVFEINNVFSKNNFQISLEFELLAIVLDGKVIHYEILKYMLQHFHIKSSSIVINYIMREDKNYMQLCLDLSEVLS